MTTPFTTAIDWVVLFNEDKLSMIEIMRDNRAADIRAGYDPNGRAIREEDEMIDRYIAQYHEERDKLALMEERQAQRWAYANLKERGAI